MLIKNCLNLIGQKWSVMRKKSHLSLSLYLLDSLDSVLLEEHRKAFLLGSILPDCKPSFVTTKHNVEETFEMVCKEIEQLTIEAGDYKRISTAYCTKLGEITHYMADYFTFPHNNTFMGNIREHCVYEKELKHALKKYIRSEKVYTNKSIAESFKTPQDLCQFVKALHNQYLLAKKSVEIDCMYIVALCHIVVSGILMLLSQNEIAIPRYAFA